MKNSKIQGRAHCEKKERRERREAKKEERFERALKHKRNFGRLTKNIREGIEKSHGERLSV